MTNHKLTAAGAAAVGIALLLLVPAGSGSALLPYTTGGTTTFAWTGDSYTTKPDGNYNNNECGWFEASVATPLLLSTEVSFTHTFTIETRWDAGMVLASKDGGVTWTYLPLSAYPALGSNTAVNNCINQITGTSATNRNGFTGFGGGDVSFDLAAHGFTTGDLVQLRFVFASDSSVTYAGWTVSGLTVGGVTQWL
jgi:hypothetical protein